MMLAVYFTFCMCFNLYLQRRC